MSPLHKSQHKDFDQAIQKNTSYNNINFRKLPKTEIIKIFRYFHMRIQPIKALKGKLLWQKENLPNLIQRALNRWQKINLLFIKLKIKMETMYIPGVAKRGRVEQRLKEHLPGGSNPIRGGFKVRINQKNSISEAEKSEARIIKQQQPSQNKKGK